MAAGHVATSVASEPGDFANSTRNATWIVDWKLCNFDSFRTGERPRGSSTRARVSCNFPSRPFIGKWRNPGKRDPRIYERYRGKIDAPYAERFALQIIILVTVTNITPAFLTRFRENDRTPQSEAWFLHALRSHACRCIGSTGNTVCISDFIESIFSFLFKFNFSILRTQENPRHTIFLRVYSLAIASRTSRLRLQRIDIPIFFRLSSLSFFLNSTC